MACSKARRHVPEPGMPWMATISELRAVIAAWPKRNGLRDDEVRMLVPRPWRGDQGTCAKAVDLIYSHE